MPSIDHLLSSPSTGTGPDDIGPAADAAADDGVPLHVARRLIVPWRGHTQQPRLLRHRTPW